MMMGNGRKARRDWEGLLYCPEGLLEDPELPTGQDCLLFFFLLYTNPYAHTLPVCLPNHSGGSNTTLQFILGGCNFPWTSQAVSHLWSCLLHIHFHRLFFFFFYRVHHHNI